MQDYLKDTVSFGITQYNIYERINKIKDYYEKDSEGDSDARKILKYSLWAFEIIDNLFRGSTEIVHLFLKAAVNFPIGDVIQKFFSFLINIEEYYTSKKNYNENLKKPIDKQDPLLNLINKQKYWDFIDG